MKKLRKMLCFFLCFAMIFGLTACGSTSKENNKDNAVTPTITEEAPKATETPAEVTTTPENPGDEQNKIVLTDQAGREVVLEAPAKTIVSCYYITTYASIALGVKDRLVGIESKADTRNIYQMATPELLNLPSVGTLKEFNLEATAALKPDLVIMPKKLLEYADALTELGIPVLVVYPESQELLEEMLTLISKACGVEENGEKLLSYYKETLDTIATMTASVPEEKKASVYMAGNSSYLTTAANSMYQANLIKLSGGKNAAEKVEGDYWTEVSYEDILAMNPDVIIIPASAQYSREELLGDAQLAEITAVKEGAVYQMPVGIEEWDSPIPSGVLGVRWLCSVLNNESYDYETMKKDVVSFYQTFYGFDLDATLITK